MWRLGLVMEPNLSPVYQSDSVSVYHSDSRMVLPTFVTESVDLVITDPPYGIEFQSGFRKTSFGQIENDAPADRDLVRSVITQCVRLVGQNRHLYVFGPPDVLLGQKVSEITTLIWDKGVIGPGDLTSSWGPAHEPISFTVSKHRHAGQSGSTNIAVRLRKSSVLRYMRPTGRKVRHPNEKPVALLRELIESSTRQGDLVLDPFAGSGSTAVAAIASGRRAIVIESDIQWVDLMVNRVKQAESLAQELVGV
jgi:DNA modification methylase